MVYGFTSACDLLKTDNYLACSFNITLDCISLPLFSHSIYLFTYLDFSFFRNQVAEIWGLSTQPLFFQAGHSIFYKWKRRIWYSEFFWHPSLVIHKKYVLEAISFCQEGKGGQYVFPFLLLLGLHWVSFILTCSQSLASKSDASRETHNFPGGWRKKTYFGILGSCKLLVHIIHQSFDYLN